MAAHSLTLKSRSGKMYVFCTENSGQSGTPLQFASRDAANSWIRQTFDRSATQSDSIRHVYQWFCKKLAAADIAANWSAVRDAELCRTLATALLAGKLHILQLPERKAVLTAPESVTPPPPSSKTLERGGKAADNTAASSENVVSEQSGSNAAGQQTPETAKVERCSDPVSMCTGEEILDLIDFELAGPLPMQWVRTYRSSQSHQNIGLGYGWRSNFNLHIDSIADEETGTVSLLLVNEEGRHLHFVRPEPGQTSYQLAEELALRAEVDGSLVLLKPDNTHWIFAPSAAAAADKPARWQLHQVMDSLGRYLQLYYNQQSQLSRIDYTGKKGIELHYNNAGLLNRIEAVTLSEKRAQTTGVVLARYQYNDDRDLVGAVNSGDEAEKYQYSQHLITVRQRASGFCHYFSWQGTGPAARCERNWGDEGIYDYRFSYDDSNRSATSIDGNGHCWQYFHDQRNLLLKKVAPDGATWQYSWNKQGKKTTETLPDGSKTRYYYNENGQLVTLEQADGAITHLQYNELGQRSVIIDAEGRQWRREYSAAGLLISDKGPDNTVTRYQYNSKNQLERVYLPGGGIQRLLWSDESQLLAVKYNDALTRYSYDSLGRLNGVVDASGLVTEYQYNLAGKLLKQSQYPADNPSDRHEQHFSYDSSGRLLSTTNANGDKTERQYGGLSQPSQILHADGSAFNYEYDNERNLTAIMRSDGARYQLDYDAQERPVRLQGFDGRQQHFQYDINGKVASVRDGSKRQLKIKRDKRGRITEQTALHGQSLASNHFYYDKIGRVLRASNGQRKLRFNYHLNGQPTEIWQDNSCIAHQYNEQGKCSTTTLPDGTTMDYRYNEEGQLAQLAVNNEPVLWRTFDSAGRETAREYQSGLQLQQQFDAFNRLTAQHWRRGEQNQQRQYSYTALHQLQKVTDNQLGDTEYQYNALDQLVSKHHSTEPSQNETHHWDSFGNPTGEGIDVKQDRLLRYQGTHYHYDDSGNQLSAATGSIAQQREFNGFNQLTSVSCNGAISRYEYDAFGRRSAKISGGERTEYYWDGDKLIGESCAGASTWYIYEPGSNKPLLLLKNGEVYYYQLDQLGTPLSLTDSQNNIVWQASYSVFGKATVTRNEIDNPIRFQGQYFDSETGLHYNHFRYYDPQTGRFISQDPIGLLGGINHYQYAPNHINWVDPLGLMCKEGEASLKAALSDAVDNCIIDQNTSAKLYALAEAGVATPSQIKRTLAAMPLPAAAPSPPPLGRPPVTGQINGGPAANDPEYNRPSPKPWSRLLPLAGTAGTFFTGMLYSPSLGGSLEEIVAPDVTIYSKYSDELLYKAVGPDGEVWQTVDPQSDIAYRAWLANGGDGTFEDWIAQGRPSELDGVGVQSEVPNKYIQQSPVDFDHVLKADYTKKGKPTGGHTLIYGDVRVVPGTESVPDVSGVYKATIQVPDPANPGQWITKTSNKSTNTMFPKDWDEVRVKTEVDSAWNSPNKVVDGDFWSSTTPSGVRVEGYISPRTTVYPVYQEPLR